MRKCKYIECLKAGIYFLLDKGIIVYIGCTTDFPRRITAHYDKKFTHIRFISCEPYIIRLRYEDRWISRFKPKYNVKTIDLALRRELIESGRFDPSNCRFSNY